MSTTLAKLAQERCEPRRGPDHALPVGDRQSLLATLPGWELEPGGGAIAKDYRFKNYHRTMAFVNAVAWIAHVQDHHPDLDVGYGHCRVRYSTHDVGGLSRNDFICAAKVEKLLESPLP
jgi:4a-hydroxytetrahydrobiopterin dehydratase